MTSSTANPLLLSYFQRQQTPAGWFDLLSVMVDGMVRNVGEAESQPFLRQMGASLAERFPLPASQTIGELETNINALLAEFNWGYIDIDASEEGLSFRHQGYRFPGMRTARRVGVTHFAPYWKGFIPVGCRDRAENRISLLAANGFTPYRTLCSATLTHNESEYV
jgi:hypothetical protein